MKNDELRHAPRVAADWVLQEEKVCGVFQASVMDLSEIGMRYRKPLPERREDEPESFLEFLLPGDAEPIRVLGWIVREEEKGSFLETAVTFMFLPKKDENRIREFVEGALEEIPA